MADGGHLVLPNGRRSAPFRGPAAAHAPYQRGLRHGGDVRLLLHRLGNGGHLFVQTLGGRTTVGRLRDIRLSRQDGLVLALGFLLLFAAAMIEAASILRLT